METPITRYTVHPDEEPMYCVSVDAEGRYVDYDDHLAALASLEAKVKEAVDLLKSAEWSIKDQEGGIYRCPWCRWSDMSGHAGDCKLAQFLKENDHDLK